jgi:hypothetical protein
LGLANPQAMRNAFDLACKMGAAHRRQRTADSIQKETT